MKIAYCRDCKAVIAAGALAPQQVAVIKGRRKVYNTMPWHKVDGAEHRNVGLLDVPDQPIPPVVKGNELDKFFKDLEKRHKADFK